MTKTVCCTESFRSPRTFFYQNMDFEIIAFFNSKYHILRSYSIAITCTPILSHQRGVLSTVDLNEEKDKKKWFWGFVRPIQ